MHSAERALRDHQSDGQLLQAHQRAADAVGRDLVAQHRHLCRQQPHPHDPHSGRRAASSCGSPTARPIRICCRPRCWPPGSTALRNKRDPGKRLDINMYTEGHKAQRRQAAAAQPARCAAGFREVGVLRESSARVRRRLSQAQERRLERLFPPSHRMGAADDARLLDVDVHRCLGSLPALKASGPSFATRKASGRLSA